MARPETLGRLSVSFGKLKRFFYALMKAEVKQKTLSSSKKMAMAGRGESHLLDMPPLRRPEPISLSLRIIADVVRWNGDQPGRRSIVHRRHRQSAGVRLGPVPELRLQLPQLHLESPVVSW